jgi:hypothetical protein
MSKIQTFRLTVDVALASDDDRPIRLTCIASAVELECSGIVRGLGAYDAAYHVIAAQIRKARELTLYPRKV